MSSPGPVRGPEPAESSVADLRRYSRALCLPIAARRGRMAGIWRYSPCPVRYFCIALAVVALAGWGCVPSTSPSLSRGHLIPTNKPRSTPVSRTLILVADNQPHNFYGKPVRFLRTSEADRLVQSEM
jgi:hypothetical protein